MVSGAQAEISRRDFIRATTLWIAGLIGTVIGAPSIAFMISPALGGKEDSAWIDLGPLDGFPLNLPTLREFTRTNLNGWERPGTSYGVFVLRQAEAEVRV